MRNIEVKKKYYHGSQFNKLDVYVEKQLMFTANVGREIYEDNSFSDYEIRIPIGAGVQPVLLQKGLDTFEEAIDAMNLFAEKCYDAGSQNPWDKPMIELMIKESSDFRKMYYKHYK